MNKIYKRYPYKNRINAPMHNRYSNKNGSIKYFARILEEKGFIVQEGKLSYLDILKLASEGKVDTAFGNNAGAPYASYLLPPAPNQEPSPGQRPPKGYKPENPNNYPPNINYVAPGVNYKLRPDEAIVLIGKTPPPAVYFSFRSYLGFVQNKPESGPPVKLVACSAPIRLCYWLCYSHTERFANRIPLLPAPKRCFISCLYLPAHP
ncbi:hypothetical protein [Clostridium sp.]|uniref:hypothetical protein n=1 Tax=Clostridium sp. TaxID=1506 RepID=UPI00260C8A80|nr:hypothetical protein [Clostridium sp.]